MPLFQCNRCNCVEDTALSNYWSARLQQVPALCSACDPKIAKWHQEFPRESADGWKTDENGLLLWNKREVEDWLGQRIDIIEKPAQEDFAPRKFVSMVAQRSHAQQ